MSGRLRCSRRRLQYTVGAATALHATAWLSGSTPSARCISAFRGVEIEAEQGKEGSDQAVATSTAPGRSSRRIGASIAGSEQHHLVSGHPKPAWKQGLEALDATEEVERAVATGAKKVMVMLAVPGLVPQPAAQHLDRLQRAFLNTSLESAVHRGETDTGSAQAAPQFSGGKGAVRFVKGSEDGLLLLRSSHRRYDNHFSVRVKTSLRTGSSSLRGRAPAHPARRGLASAVRRGALPLRSPLRRGAGSR